MTGNVLLNSNAHIKLHVLDDHQVLLSATYPDEFYFSGALNIKSLHGTIEIMGFKLIPEHDSITAYSPKENYLLKMSMLNGCDSSIIDESFLQTLTISSRVQREIVSTPLTHLLLLTKNTDCHILQSVSKYYNMPGFSEENCNEPVAHSLFARVTKCRTYQEHDEWRNISDSIVKKRNPKTILCGGNRVGKSTLLKFLINKTLEKWSEIIVIDMDPGQPEFTIMGCLSIISVRQPVFGPNFSHLKTPIRCLYFGEISVSSCIDTYVRCVKHLINHCYLNYSHLPWFINTMGFVEGPGVKLLFDIISSTRPTDLIQITSSKRKENFPEKLESSFWKIQGYTASKFPKYELHLVPSVAESNHTAFDDTSCGLSSATRRNIVTLSYFSKVSKSNGNLLSIVPRKISYGNIKILINEQSSLNIPAAIRKTEILYCINANLVALCRTETNDDFTECLGFGIVRGFDERSEDLYVITPLNDEQLRDIDAIVMSSFVQLPEIVYNKQVHTTHNIDTPYTMRVSRNLLHQKIKKSSSRIRHQN